jgi:DNA-binding MarR family transcriptional regulator
VQFERHTEAVSRTARRGAAAVADPPAGGDPSDAVLDQVLAGARVVSGVIASSLAEVEDRVSLPQLRVLVTASDRGALTLGDVADLLEVHASSATRLVDRLVRSHLLDRRDDPDNRRQLQLTLTPQGHDLVDSVLEHRRDAFRRLLATQPAADQEAVAEAMNTLANAVSVHTEAQTWVVPTTRRQK